MVTLNTGEIKDVWSHNLEEEMARIRDLVDDYNYIAMDTEFPGIVTKPSGTFKTQSEYVYQTLRVNVDQLKIIQLGLTFSDPEGNLAKHTCTWQFNFKFNLNEDKYAKDSIDLLSKSGIEFKKNELNGIDTLDFGELLMSSGIVLNEKIKWISFHSGYDFGYLLKVLTCSDLPRDEIDFFQLVKTYFPCIYDIKYIMKSCKNLKGGLNELAEDLDIKRIGPQHQAGSDSLLTGTTFFKLRKMFFEGQIDDSKYLGILYGFTSYLQDSNGNMIVNPQQPQHQQLPLLQPLQQNQQNQQLLQSTYTQQQYQQYQMYNNHINNNNNNNNNNNIIMASASPNGYGGMYYSSPNTSTTSLYNRYSTAYHYQTSPMSSNSSNNLNKSNS